MILFSGVQECTYKQGRAASAADMLGVEDISVSGGTFANSFFFSTDGSFKSTPSASATQAQGQHTLSAGSVPQALISMQHMRVGIGGAQQAPAAGETSDVSGSVRFAALNGTASSTQPQHLDSDALSTNLSKMEGVLASEGQVEVTRDAGSRSRRVRSLEESKEATAAGLAANEAGVGGLCSPESGGEQGGTSQISPGGSSGLQTPLSPRSPNARLAYKPQPSAVRAGRRLSLLKQEQVNVFACDTCLASLHSH